MTFYKAALTTALLLMTTPAMAQVGELSKDPYAQPNGIYKIDPKHTSVTWKVWHMGASHYTARFSKVDGELDYNQKDPTKSKVKVTIPASSVDTGMKDFDEEIAGKQFFGGDKNPDITFESVSIVKTGADKGKIEGRLTLNGITRPVFLDVKFNGGLMNKMLGAHDMGFSATTVIKRSDFNVNYGIPMVSDEVEIAIETEFLQKAAHAAEPAAPASK